MNVHQWTSITRDYIRLEDIMVDGVAVDIADLTAALVPIRTQPTGTTTWITPTAATDGTPQILVAGVDADATGAVVVTTDMDLWGKVTKTGTTVAAKLARINVD